MAPPDILHVRMEYPRTLRVPVDSKSECTNECHVSEQAGSQPIDSIEWWVLPSAICLRLFIFLVAEDIYHLLKWVSLLWLLLLLLLLRLLGSIPSCFLSEQAQNSSNCICRII